jgi:hypothetical protein
MLRVFRLVSSILAAAALLATTAQEADAALKHRYSFTSNINDSVGSADGTLVDPGSATGVFAAGKLNLTANTGEPSDAISNDAYVDLPDGIISGLGTTATFETWVTVDTNRNWSEIYSFGQSRPDTGGEDISAGFGRYITLIPDTGDGPNTFRFEAIQFPDGAAGNPAFNPFGASNVSAPNGATLPTGVNHHLVSIIDPTDTNGGANPNGTMRIYLNGALIGASPIYAGFTLASLPDVNNWLGRSQWPDPLFDGSFDEFRIYDNGISANQIALNSVVGPDQFATAPAEGIFSLVVNTTNGSVTLKNNVNLPLNINYYEVTSNAGALNAAGWDSLDDKESGDPAGQGWDESGGANANQLIELFLAAAGDTIAANEQITLGNAFNPATFGSGNPGDLNFKFGFTTGALLTGGVSYVSSPGGGDFDGDGDVDGRDFLRWQRGQSPNPLSATDLAAWQANYGAGSLVAAVGAVPEPTTVVFMAAFGLIMPLWRSRLRMVTAWRE